MPLTAEQILEYIIFEANRHRATRDSLIRGGKTYRSRDITRENGYLAALRDVQDVIELPAKNRELQEAMAKFAETLKS